MKREVLDMGEIEGSLEGHVRCVRLTEKGNGLERLKTDDMGEYHICGEGW